MAIVASIRAQVMRTIVFRYFLEHLPSDFKEYFPEDVYDLAGANVCAVFLFSK